MPKYGDIAPPPTQPLCYPIQDLTKELDDWEWEDQIEEYRKNQKRVDAAMDEHWLRGRW